MDILIGLAIIFYSVQILMVNLYLISEDIKGGLVGISVDLVNSGEGTAYDIYWEMNATGGFLYIPRKKSGEINNPLGPGNRTTINIKPMMGFGRGQIFFYCK